MWAILSDVHGNLEALDAVLEDIDRHAVERVVCLGDTLGYGPNPGECLDRVWQWCNVCLLGNHDQAAMFDPDGFGASAQRAVFWTRDRLERDRTDDSNDFRNRRWDFLAAMPRSHREEDVLYVHGSPRNPLNEYVFPEDIYNQRKMERLFDLTDRYCFKGHTHVPGVFLDEVDGQYQFFAPEEIDYAYTLADRKALVNVGSVGQPRDGDWRACYVLYDPPVVRFRRVEYDVEATIRKIYAVPELENFLGDRLREGR